MTGNNNHMTDQCATMSVPGTTLPFADINEPGVYICNWSGHLVRVPEGGVAQERSPLDIVSHEPLYVTKIANDPFVAITKARVLAANHDLFVNF